MTNYKYNKMIEINSKIKELEKEIKQLKDELDPIKSEFMAEHESGNKSQFKNHVIYYQSITSKRFDTSALKDTNIKLYNQFLKETSTIRFYIKAV